MNLFGTRAKSSSSYQPVSTREKKQKKKPPKISESHTYTFQNLELQSWNNSNKKQIISDIIRELEKNADPQASVWSVYYHKRNMSPVIFIAFNYGRNPKYNRLQPFTPEENLELVQAWLRSPFKKIDVTGSDLANESNVSMLYLACLYDYPNTAIKLLEANADPNLGNITKRHSPLHILAQTGRNLELINPLLEAKADINALTAEGETPLAIAAYYGHLDVVKLLLQNNADPAKVGTHGHSALYLAAHQNHADIAEMLIGYGADPNFIGGDDTPALYVAAELNSHRVVKFLIELDGIKIDDGIDGYSPYFIAIAKRNLYVAKLISTKNPAKQINNLTAEEIFYKAFPEALIAEFVAKLTLE